uniref:Uncharacterized protein n=1 Tax=Biomphalaria glabrata TaxID=6526 RepID=A0A2C9KSV3_BIOGL
MFYCSQHSRTSTKVRQSTVDLNTTTDSRNLTINRIKATSGQMKDKTVNRFLHVDYQVQNVIVNPSVNICSLQTTNLILERLELENLHDFTVGYTKNCVVDGDIFDQCSFKHSRRKK